MYATTSLFHFLGLMKYVGEYIEDKNERRHVDATDLAIAFMQENINRKLTLGEIADEVNLSVSYFSNLFLKRQASRPCNTSTCCAYEKPATISISPT